MEDIEMSLTDRKKIKALRNGLTISTLVAASAAQAQTIDKSTAERTITQQSSVTHDTEKKVSSPDTITFEQAWNELFPFDKIVQEVKQEFLSTPGTQESLNFEQAWNELFPLDKKVQEVKQELLNTPETKKSLHYDYLENTPILADKWLMEGYNKRYLSYLKNDVPSDKEKAYIDFFEKTHRELVKEEAIEVELNEIDLLSFVNDEILDYSENTIKTKVENFHAHGKTIDPYQHSYVCIENAVAKLTSFDKQNENLEQSKKEQDIAFQQMKQHIYGR